MKELSRLVKELNKLKFLDSRLRVWTSSNNNISEPKDPEHVIIFLHGSRITAFGMQKWMQKFWSPPENVALILPSSPMRNYTLSKGRSRSVWHDRIALDVDHPHEDLKAIDEISEELGNLVGQLKNLGCNNLSMGGFSMGGHQAIHTVYRHSVDVKKCFSMSTYLINKSAVYDKLTSDNSNTDYPPLHISHGVQDDITPISWAVQAYDKMRHLGVNCTFEPWNHNKHDMNSAQLDNIVHWVQQK